MIVLVTDGQETTSHASLQQAIRSARHAHVAVYPVAIVALLPVLRLLCGGLHRVGADRDL